MANPANSTIVPPALESCGYLIVGGVLAFLPVTINAEYQAKSAVAVTASSVSIGVAFVVGLLMISKGIYIWNRIAREGREEDARENASY